MHTHSQVTETTEHRPLPGGGIRTGYGFKRAWLNETAHRRDIGALADATRCWWGISPHKVEAKGIEHAVAVYGGVTRALFRILPNSWEQLRNADVASAPS